MEVYDSQYLNSVFFPEQELIELTWKPSTDKMTEEEYKQEVLNFNDVVSKYCPKKILVDASSMFFVVVPELQEWTSRESIAVSLSVGMNKSAFVVSKDLFSQVSIEQTMDEEVGSIFINRYFDDKEDAKKWLLSL